MSIKILAEDAELIQEFSSMTKCVPYIYHKIKNLIYVSVYDLKTTIILEGIMLNNDAHVHIGDESIFSKINTSDIAQKPIAYSCYKQNTVQDYLLIMEKSKVNKALVIPFPFPELNIDNENKNIINYVNIKPDKLFPLLLLPSNLDKITKYKFYGFKEHFLSHSNFSIKQKNEAYSFLQQNEFILLIHERSSLIIDVLANIRRNFPKLKILIAHSGRKKAYSGNGITDVILPTFGKDEYFYYDTSTIRNSNVIEQMVTQIGSERILFGSDTPFFQNEGEDTYFEELNIILNANISSREQERILSSNFINLLNIESMS